MLIIFVLRCLLIYSVTLNFSLASDFLETKSSKPDISFTPLALSIRSSIDTVGATLTLSERKNFATVFSAIQPIAAKLPEKDRLYILAMVLPGKNPPELKTLNLLLPFNPVMELNAEVQVKKRAILEKAAVLGSKEAITALIQPDMGFSAHDGDYFAAFKREIMEILTKHHCHRRRLFCCF